MCLDEHLRTGAIGLRDGANRVTSNRMAARNATSKITKQIEERWSKYMPEEETLERAHEDAAEGKSPSTQAGEFVREEIDHIREGKHGARTTKQAIAIGLSKARRAGVKLPPPNSKTTSASTRKKAAQDSARAKSRTKPSPNRSRATKSALKREGKSAASSRALARQAHQSAMARGRKNRVGAAKKATRTRARTSKRK